MTDITKEQFEEVATLSHTVALDHYSEGPRTCKETKQTLDALTNSAVSIIAEYTWSGCQCDAQLNAQL